MEREFLPRELALGPQISDVIGEYSSTGKNGYQKLSPENYVPQDGDIRIFSSVAPKDPRNPKAAEIHGHIQVYNAKQQAWVSEYRQNNSALSDIPRVFRDRPDAKYTNYRFNAF